MIVIVLQFPPLVEVEAMAFLLCGEIVIVVGG